MSAAAEGAVLFDLDGTFADTAPDMAAALNRLLAGRGRAPLPLAAIRPYVSTGSRGMLRVGFGLEPGDADYDALRTEYLALYAEDLCRETALFPGIADLVAALRARQLCWGIVTNKPAYLTDPLLAALSLPAPPDCVVSGDSTPKAKPHPEPLLHACRLIDRDPALCWYIGDDHRDIVAGRAAGMTTLAAGYGYLGVDLHPLEWGAHGVIEHPLDVLQWLDADLPPQSV